MMKDALHTIRLGTVLCALAVSGGNAAETVWHDGCALGLEGKGWTETAAPYDRLPARAEKTVPKAVWNLSRQSAGLAVRFDSDADRLHLKWTVTGSSLAMPHMPATGVSGLDLYRQRPGTGWRFVKNCRPGGVQNSATVATGATRGKPERYVLYLPLYNGTKDLKIGVPAGASIRPAAPPSRETAKPVVIYGTSITQGGCASRPGMAYTAILGRMLDREVLNLGFSGNGRMQEPVVALLAELDPCIYIVDCLWNMGGLGTKEVKGRVRHLVTELRERHVATPILLIGQTHFAGAHPTSSTLAQEEAFRALRNEGVKGLHLLPPDRLIGMDGEGTVDGCHPNDLGMMRQAEGMAPTVVEILAAQGKTPASGNGGDAAP